MPATATQSDIRAFLLDAVRRESPYDFLHNAIPYLERATDDEQIRLLTARQFLAIGLTRCAREIVAQAPAGPDRDELAAIIDRIPERPDERAPLGVDSPWFSDNLSAAANRFPRFADLADTILSTTRNLDVFITADGAANPLISRRVGAGPRRWLPSILNWRYAGENANVLPAPGTLFVTAYALEGLGCGRLLDRLYRATNRMFLSFGPRLHICEPNLAQLGVWLSLADRRPLLEDERCMLWIGPKAALDYTTWRESHDDELEPQFVIRQPGWGPAQMTLMEQPLKIAMRRRAERRAALLAALRAHYPSDAAGAIAKRFAQRDRTPLKIIGITSRFTTFLQYSMRDIAETAQAAGHEFTTLIEPHDYTAALPGETILERILAHQPDLIVMLDHNRAEFKDLYTFDAPFCNWIQDDLPNLFGPGRGAGVTPFDLVFGAIGTLRARQSGYPEDQIRVAPVPVNARRFHAGPLSESDRARYGCEVSFVSNHSIAPERFLDEVYAGAEAPVRRLIGALDDDLSARIARDDTPAVPLRTNALIQQIAAELGMRIDSLQADQLRRGVIDKLITLRFRQQALEALSRLGVDLRLYGNGWENHPRLAKYARGPAAHGDELRRIYQATRVNLQLMPTGAIHQRLIEGLFSGGFFLIRRTAADLCGDLCREIDAICAAHSIADDAALRKHAERDPALRAKLDALTARLFAPGDLYDGFVADFALANARGFPLDAAGLLPRYHDVAFGNEAELGARLQRFLNDASARREIATVQREAVLPHFSYDAALERLFDFAAEHFGRLATSGDHSRGFSAAIDS